MGAAEGKALEGVLFPHGCSGSLAMKAENEDRLVNKNILSYIYTIKSRE